MRENRAGVTLVANGSDVWNAASAIGFTSRVIVADAREPGSIEEEWPMPEAEKRLPGTGPLLSPIPAGMRDLAGEPEPAPPFRPYLLRPTPEEQARRLVVALATRPEIRRIAVAVPSRGGNERLALAFGMVARASGRETQDIVYEPGRRDYGPEATQFMATGAQAILFAGPGEETAEWLAALAAKKSSPLLLGTNELDPAGFHVRTRSRLENALVVGDDWDDRDTDLVARMEGQGEGSSEAGFRRGFRMGWTVARNVLEGSFTPSSLRLALEARAPRGDALEGGVGMITGIQREAGSGSSEVVVPLFAVRNGTLVPVAAN